MNKKLLIKDVRGFLLVSQASGRGGFSGWLRLRLDPKRYGWIEQRLGNQFSHEEFYRLLFPKSVDTCRSPNCSKPVTFIKNKLKYKRYCSPACGCKDPRTMEKRALNELKRSGGKYTNATQREEIRKLNSAIKKSEAYKAGIRERELKRSGGLYSDPRGRPDACKKRVASHRANELKRSGGKYTNSSQRLEVREKIRKTVSDPNTILRARNTYKKRTGFDHPMHNPSVVNQAQKSRKRVKTVEFRGRRWNVQGYEDIAIRKLIQYGISPNRVGPSLDTFKYKGAAKHGPSRYLPDFHIKDSKLYVEIKSTFTLSDASDRSKISPKVISKGKGVINDGKEFLLLVIGHPKAVAAPEKPRKGKILSYIFATPEAKDFKLKHNFKSLKHILGRV